MVARYDRVGLNDVVFHTVMTLLAPFLIYWTAEAVFHASGVIAVVAGGVLTKILSDQHINARHPEISVTAVRTWEIFVYLLNGIIFVLLGIGLPPIVVAVVKNAQIHTGQAILYGVIVWLIIFTIRTLWTYGNQVVWYLRNRDQKPTVKMAIISGLTGVRGAVTMAAVMTVPAVIQDGSAFPQRDLLIFIAAVVVIVSLLVATIMLPIVTKVRSSHDFTQPEISDAELPETGEGREAELSESRARIFAIQVGIATLREQQNDTNRAVVYELITRKQATIAQIREQLMGEKAEDVQFDNSELRRIALDAQRNRLQQLLVEEKISILIFSIQSRRIERLEKLIGADKKFDNSAHWVRILTRRALRSVRIWLSDESNKQFKAETSLAIREMAKAAIKALSQHMEKYDGDTVLHRMERQNAYELIVVYRYQIEHEKHPDTPEQRELDDKQRMELELLALNAQRETIQDLYEQGRITRQAGINIRQFINYAETAALAGKNEE